VLVKELDGLPLALSTAGAYLEQVTTSFSEYLRLYKASWLKLQLTSPQLSSYEDRSLYTTWQLSFDRIERQNELSAKLLKLWAYFDRQDVWFELLQHGGSADSNWVSQLTEDELSFNEAVRVLCNYGLVDLDLSSDEQIRSRVYSMHSCVHSWTIYVLNKEWDEDLARLALCCTASEVPGHDTAKWWLIQRRLLQHAARCAYFIMTDRVRTEGIEWSIHSLGALYADQGKLAEAEKMYLRALQGKEEALGPKHTSTLNTVNNLGLLYADQDKLAEAEKMYLRALQGKEEALGPKHTLTLNTVTNLGALYADQGKLAEAENMYLRALQGYEEALDPSLVSLHIPALNTMANLGDLFSEKDEKEIAKTMYMRAIRGFTSVKGVSSNYMSRT
jgi:tetratricopeptide (TPR) repeat protein